MQVKCVEDGQVELYYDNSKKFETTNQGIKIAGNHGDGITLENGGTVGSTVFRQKNTTSNKSYYSSVSGTASNNAAPSSWYIRDESVGATRFEILTGGDVRINGGDLLFGDANKGIVLGNTTNTNANTLDDYEEGTWTPTINFTGGTNVSYSGSPRNAEYVKVGNLVYIRCLYLQLALALIVVR